GERDGNGERHHGKVTFHLIPLFVELKSVPPPVTATGRGGGEKPSVSVIRKAVMSVISCSVNAGASPGSRSKGGSLFTFFRYSAGRSSYCQTVPSLSIGYHRRGFKSRSA